MKTFAAILLTLFCLDFQLAFTQNPQLLRSDLSITPFVLASNSTMLARMSHDPVSGYNFVLSPNGDVFRIYTDGLNNYLTQVGGTAQHNINYAQGMCVHNGSIFIVGNHKEAGQQGFGLVKKAVPNGSGGWNWVTVLTTAPYPSSATLYDHAFSNIIFSLDGAYMYITSGSRTDHGEIQTTGGLYPNTREVPLTSAMFKLPANATNVYFANNNNVLQGGGYIFARGFRNMFDMAFAPNGDFFGVENSGDRDDPEEMNWLIEGEHYGFPWEMGGNQTPQQFAGYTPSTDLLINHDSYAWNLNYFYNDPTFPSLPTGGVTFRQPVKNYGPDADKYRDAITGNILDASTLNTFITSFTPHRSPLGLIFDQTKKLGSDYRGKGFMLSYSSNAPGEGYLQPFNDVGEDLMLLDLKKEANGSNYRMNTYRIAQGFTKPVDTELIGNKLYIVELGGQIWQMTLPKLCESVVSGNWNSSGSWTCGHIPWVTDDVVINTPHTITLSGTIGNVKSLELKGGLTFATAGGLGMH